MELSLNELLKGKGTLIKGKEYLSTEAYVTPFLERMSKFTDDFRVQAISANQISLTPNREINVEDTVFNRVNIEAILPDEYQYEGHKQVVGFVYALDTRKPIVKQYVGAVRSACLNLCVFNPQALQAQELNPGQAIDYRFLTNCLSLTDNINCILKQLSEREYTKKQLFTEVGTWVDNCLSNKNIFSTVAGKVKLPESLPVEVYKNLFYNEKSNYYTKDDVVNGFDIYNAYTDLICNGKKADLVNRFEKTYLVKEIIGI